MRITGGELGRRLLAVPKDRGVRPTQDRVRAALFSSLAGRVPGSRFLDLFAGSGAVGIEAWSRGAASVCWVERSPRVVKVLRDNVQRLCASENCRVVEADVRRFLSAGVGGPFDLVFADPPYGAEAGASLADVLEALRSGTMLAEGAVVVWESASGESIGGAAAGWGIRSDRTYGGTRLRQFVRLAE